MKQLIVGVAALGFVALAVSAQTPVRMGASTYVQATAPNAAWLSKGDLWFNTATNALNVLTATAPATWATLSTGGSSGLPAGLIAFIASGTCPAGFTEVSALNGKLWRGTVAANGNVGTTAGNDSYTPAGSVAAPTVSWPAAVPTHSGTTASFSGNALGTHAHELPWQIPSTTTIRQIAVGTFGTGTSRAATAVSAAGTANTTSAAVALSQAVSAGTPAGSVTITSQGTVAWPASVPTTSAPAFTGQAATVIPAYVNLIACQAN